MCIEDLANIILSYLDYRKQENELISLNNRNLLTTNVFGTLITLNYIRRHKHVYITLISDNLYSVRYAPKLFKRPAVSLVTAVISLIHEFGSWSAGAPSSCLLGPWGLRRSLRRSLRHKPAPGVAGAGRRRRAGVPAP